MKTLIFVIMILITPFPCYSKEYISNNKTKEANLFKHVVIDKEYLINNGFTPRAGSDSLYDIKGIQLKKVILLLGIDVNYMYPDVPSDICSAEGNPLTDFNIDINSKCSIIVRNVDCKMDESKKKIIYNTECMVNVTVVYVKDNIPVKN